MFKKAALKKPKLNTVTKTYYKTTKVVPAGNVTTWNKVPLTEAPNYTRENFTKSMKTKVSGNTTKVEFEGWSPPKMNMTFDDDEFEKLKPKKKSDGPPPKKFVASSGTSGSNMTKGVKTTTTTSYKTKISGCDPQDWMMQ